MAIYMVLTEMASFHARFMAIHHSLGAAYQAGLDINPNQPEDAVYA